MEIPATFRRWIEARAVAWPLAIVLLSVGAAAIIVFEVHPLFILVVLLGLLIAAASRLFFLIPLMLYTFAIFFDYPTRLGDIGTITKWLGIFAAVVLLVRGLLVRTFHSLPRSAWLLLAFCFWGLLTIFWSVEADWSRQALMTMFGLISVSIILGITRFSDGELELIRKLIVVGGTAAALFGLFLYVTGQFFAPDDLKTGEMIRLGVALERGRWVNPNDFSASLLLPISLSLSGILTSRTLSSRAWPYLAFTTMALATLLSLSRSGILGLIVVLVLAFRRLETTRLRNLVILGTLGLLVWQFFPILMGRFTGPRFWSGAGRLTIWEVGLEALKSYWVIGSGLGSFPVAYNQFMMEVGSERLTGSFRDAHDIYLELGVEVGVVGLFVFLAGMVTLLRRLRRVDRPAEGPLPAAFMEAALFALLVVGIFHGILREKFFWLTVGLAMQAGFHEKRETAPSGANAAWTDRLAAGEQRA